MTKSEAQATYRAAWQMWLTSRTEEARKEAERLMDSVQEACVDGGRPGPEWEAFIATLPGFVEYWRGNREACNRMGREMFGEKWRGI